VGLSDLSAPFSKLREKRSRKKFPNKQITAQDPWPSIRICGIRLLIKLHGIKPHGIKTQGIMPHDARLLSISGLSRDLLLPRKMKNKRLTNPSTSKSRKRWRMIKTARSYPSGCRA
jgi:hypothetical protein